MKIYRHIIRALLLGIGIAAVMVSGIFIVWLISFSLGSRIPVEPFRTIGAIALPVYELPILWIKPPHNVAWKTILEIVIPIAFWGGLLEAVLTWKGNKK